MKIPDRHLQYLVRYFQAGNLNLASDGIYGPLTARELNLAMGHQDPMRQAFKTALNDVGRAEVPLGSNGSTFIDALRQETSLPRRGGGEWCAVFVSAHLQRTGLDVGSRGATGICRALEELPGGFSLKPEECETGKVYLALRKRGLLGHHVQFFRITEGVGGKVVRHVGGNEGHKVKTAVWSTRKFFKGVKKVVGYE
jgi:hypothetical protein